jgi:hypothetical protein
VRVNLESAELVQQLVRVDVRICPSLSAILHGFVDDKPRTLHRVAKGVGIAEPCDCTMRAGGASLPVRRERTGGKKCLAPAAMHS